MMTKIDLMFVFFEGGATLYYIPDCQINLTVSLRTFLHTILQARHKIQRIIHPPS